MQLNKSKIKVIENIRDELCEWGYDAILFQIKNGFGKIKQTYYTKGNIVNKQLCINDMPLYTLNSDNYFCPTCQKMIEEGYGFVDKGRVVTKEIIRAQDSKLPLAESLKYLENL